MYKSNLVSSVANILSLILTFIGNLNVSALPDFYSRHQVVPDVWSYPSCFETSNAKGKTQVENSKTAQRDVFLDLSRAPPRFSETVISEEAEEDNTVLEKTDENQHEETMQRRQLLNCEDLSPGNLQYDFEAGVSQTQQDDTLEIVMSDKEEELLETASSFLKNTSEDNNSVNYERQSDVSIGGDSDAENEDLVASDKRHHVLGKESLTMKSLKIAAAEHTDDVQDDLSLELIRKYAEEIWQEEDAGAVLADKSEEHVEGVSSLSTSATHESCAVVGMKSEKTSTHVDDIVDKQHFPELGTTEPVQLYTKLDNSDHSGRTQIQNNDLPACLPSGGHSRETTDMNHNFLINSPFTKTEAITDESVYTEPVVFHPDRNPNSRLSVQHDPLIDTGPLQDRSPTLSSKDLGWDDNTFDSEGIELADILRHGATLEGLEEESDVGKPAGLRSDGKESESPVAFCDSDELTSDLSSVKDGICDDRNPVDLDNLADSVASHMVCLEFDEKSDTETESTMSDEDESLWSTFPEFFHPSRRLTYSNNKQAELSLAEEDQDTDGLDSTKTDQDVALVGVRELSTAHKSNFKDTVDGSEEQDGVSFTDDSEELSTASSESFEYTYEVNAEFPSESEEVSEDSGYVTSIGKNERGIEEVCDQRKVSHSFSPQNVMVKQDTCISDKCDIPLRTLSDLNDKLPKDDGPIACSEVEITSQLDQENSSEKNECTEISKDILQEQQPRNLLESRHGSGNSSFFFVNSLKEPLPEKTEVLSKGWKSLDYPDTDERILDGNFSPSDWIIPSPPSPTPELQESDICIVSPPPDELDAELQHLIVPPPPSSADTLSIVSGIRIASPPPLEINDNEFDHLLTDFSDMRFLSLTDDHKIARNNVLISARNFDSNFTEDRKIQAQNVKTDALSISMEGDNVHKSVGMPSFENTIFDSSGKSRSANQAPVKQSSTTNVPTTHSPNSRSSLPNPLTDCSVTLDDLPATWKQFHKGKCISDEHPNKDTVYSSLDIINDDIGGKRKNSKKTDELNSLFNSRQENVLVQNRSSFPLKEKPPIPPKPRIFRAATDDGMYDSFKSSSVEDSGVISDQEPGNKQRRSVSFAFGLPYAPAPYASSRSQSVHSAQSSVLRSHKSTSHTPNLLSEQTSKVNSSAPTASTLFATNKPHFPGNEASFSPQRPPLMRHRASHPSLRDSEVDLGLNASGDVLPQPLIESSVSQLPIIDPQEDTCNNSLNSPPVPDSPPPPLPESSPPKLIPEFHAEDFHFREPLTETFQDDTQNNSLQSATFGLPCSARELKFKRSLASLDYKQGDSSSNVSERRETTYGGSTLSRSQTLTSFHPETNQRSSSVDWSSHREAVVPGSRTKRSSFPFDECCNLKDVRATGSSNSSQECQSLKAKCLNVCEEGLSKVTVLENRLEICLNRNAAKTQFSNEVKNWPLIFQNNARFLACDIKVISSSVRRGSPQVVSAVETSLDSLEKVTESCEKTCSMLNEKSKQNGHSLVAMVREVFKQYRDIISDVKNFSGLHPVHSDAEVLVKKTDSMATQIASLIRELRNY